MKAKRKRASKWSKKAALYFSSFSLLSVVCLNQVHEGVHRFSRVHTIPRHAKEQRHRRATFANYLKRGQLQSAGIFEYAEGNRNTSE